jgi:hypothetical protein
MAHGVRERARVEGKQKGDACSDSEYLSMETRWAAWRPSFRKLPMAAAAAAAAAGAESGRRSASRGGCRHLPVAGLRLWAFRPQIRLLADPDI